MTIDIAGFESKDAADSLPMVHRTGMRPSQMLNWSVLSEPECKDDEMVPFADEQNN
jgi:hypothetical protein